MKKKKVLTGFLIVLLVLVIIPVVGCLYLYNPSPSVMVYKSDSLEDAPVKVACIGDSITYGYGITDWSKNNYPVVLQHLLGEEYLVQNFAVSGCCVHDNADYPYRALQHHQNSIAYDADIIVFMMGSNDTKPENWFGEEAFKTALIDLLDDYTQGSKNPLIYICTTPACFFIGDSHSELTNFGLRPAYADMIANITLEVAEELGYPTVDIHNLTAENPQWFEGDGVHPNNDGAAAIAEAVYQAISNTA